MLCIVYGINYLDSTSILATATNVQRLTGEPEVTLSYASVTGIQRDLGLKGDNYQWLGSIFYFGASPTPIDPQNPMTDFRQAIWDSSILPRGCSSACPWRNTRASWSSPGASCSPASPPWRVLPAPSSSGCCWASLRLRYHQAGPSSRLR